MPHRHHGHNHAVVLDPADDPESRRQAVVPTAAPDLNPIEQVFAKIKHWMRIAQKRTIDDACDHIGHLVRNVLPAECSKYFANAGYASIKT